MSKMRNFKTVLFPLLIFTTAMMKLKISTEDFSSFPWLFQCLWTWLAFLYQQNNVIFPHTIFMFFFLVSHPFWMLALWKNYLYLMREDYFHNENERNFVPKSTCSFARVFPLHCKKTTLSREKIEKKPRSENQTHHFYRHWWKILLSTYHIILFKRSSIN